jgi:hypothetical protein
MQTRHRFRCTGALAGSPGKMRLFRLFSNNLAAATAEKL